MESIGGPQPGTANMNESAGPDVHPLSPGVSPGPVSPRPGRTVMLTLIGLLLLAATAHGAGIRYFGDSSDSTYYPTSWGTHSGASWVELAESSHFPVDPQHPFLGGNSLPVELGFRSRWRLVAHRRYSGLDAL